jgi:hypothetical protein
MKVGTWVWMYTYVGTLLVFLQIKFPCNEKLPTHELSSQRLR